MLDSLDPFLANLNPVIRYLEFQKTSVADFLVDPAAALSGSYEPVARRPGAAPRPAPARLPRARRRSRSGRSAWRPTAATATSAAARSNGFSSAKNGIFPNFDCKNTDYSQRQPPSAQDTDEHEIRAGQTVEGINNGDPPGTTPRQFAPCFIGGDFANANDFQAPSGAFGDGASRALRRSVANSATSSASPPGVRGGAGR